MYMYIHVHALARYNVHVYVSGMQRNSRNALLNPYTCVEKQRCGCESHLGQLTFSLKRRESELSQLVLLCCLALYVSQLFKHVHVHVVALHCLVSVTDFTMYYM